MQYCLTHSVFFSRPQVVVLKDSLLLACKTYRDSIPLSKYGFILPTVCFFLQTTSGGTESLLLACKTYRDWAKEEKGIIKPEM
jgi:hypothetical protein